MNTAFEEGRAAYSAGLSLHFNPFEPGNPAFIEWERGYASAREAHKEVLTNARAEEKRALDKRTSKVYQPRSP